MSNSTVSSSSSSGSSTFLPPDTSSSTPTSAPPTSSPNAPTSEQQPSNSVVIISSVVTATPPGGTGTPEATTIFRTSTAPPPEQSTVPSNAQSTSAAGSSTSSAAAATNTTHHSKGSSGLTGGGKVAVAVVVPVAVVALLVLAGIWFWRKRKSRKNAEELRKKEIEEYGFNPNNDPTLPAVSTTDGTSEMRDDAGYRGWGATSTQRNPSTNLSGSRGIGVALSDEGSNGYHQPGSPTHHSEGYSNDPLVHPAGRPSSGDSETVGALAAPMASGGRRDNDNIHRGPSNASSAYSTANRSDGSGDAPIPVAPQGGGQYYEDGSYYNDAQPSHGPYGDGSYGGGQPIIQDVQARRNTRIEKPSVYPPQGNSGIAQNF